MDNAHFTCLARRLVCEWVNDNRDTKISISDIYIVWLTKVLQNNKALLATNQPDGLYFEVTYNGDKGEVYLDAYSKVENIAYKVDELESEGTYGLEIIYEA